MSTAPAETEAHVPRHTHTGDLPHIVRLRLALEDCNAKIEVLLGKLKTIARELENSEKNARNASK